MARVLASERKKQFIAAAIDVIAAGGCEGATTRAIAERAKAPLASLHYCFASKEQLFFSIFEELLQVQDSSFHVRPMIGLGRATSLLLRQMQNWSEKEGDLTRAQLELYFWVVRQDSAYARKAYQRVLALFTSMLTQALRPEDDRSLIETFARIIIAFGDGSVVQDLVFDDKRERERIFDTLAESLERLADSHQLPVTTGAANSAR